MRNGRGEAASLRAGGGETAWALQSAPDPARCHCGAVGAERRLESGERSGLWAPQDAGRPCRAAGARRQPYAAASLRAE